MSIVKTIVFANQKSAGIPHIIEFIQTKADHTVHPYTADNSPFLSEGDQILYLAVDSDRHSDIISSGNISS